MIRGMSLSASSEEEGQDESEGREMDLEDSDVEMCSVQGAPSSNSWRPSVDCGIYMTGRVDSAEVQVLCVFELEALAKFLCQELMVLFDSGWPWYCLQLR